MQRRLFFLSAIIACLLIPKAHGQADRSSGRDHGGLGTGFYGSSGTRSGGAGVFVGVYETANLPRLWPNGGLFLDLGITGPTPKTPVDGTISVNWQTTWNPPWKAGDESPKLVMPFVTVGYTRYFVTDNALNYGAGVLWRIPGGKNFDNHLRLEYRELRFPDGRRQPTFRIGYLGNVYDE